MISDLEHKIPYVQTGLIKVSRIERHDWRPVWDLCRRIQSEFKVSSHFSSKSEQQATWDRFQAVRQKASRLADEERDSFKFQSECIRDDILGRLKSCNYSPLNDLLFFFDPTTAENMKENAIKLKSVGSYLSEHRSKSSGCFPSTKVNASKLSSVRENLMISVGSSAESLQMKGVELKNTGVQRTKKKGGNGNRGHGTTSAETKISLKRRWTRETGRLSGFSGFKVSYRSQTAPSGSFIFEEWLEEAHQKLANIEESIDRIRGWIDADEQRLNG